jgi:serine protease Do
LKAYVPRLIGIVLALTLILGCEMAGTRAQDTPAEGQQRSSTLSGGFGAGGPIEPSPFVAVADKVMPGVVSIDTRKKVETGSGFEFDEPFGRIFRDLVPDMPRREYQVPSYASGFVLNKDGYIATNHHVVNDADEIVVRMFDETEYEAEVIGSDPNTDIAILKIDNGDDLPMVKLGDSDDIRVGDWAIAIGNPFGRLDGTVTVGVISAKGRSALSIVGGTPALQDFIQTDASINFGNSGGPLVNINGEAVGMNTAINPLGQGIGFAIPINLVKRVADEIIQHGKVAWGYLGILPQEITRELAESFGVEPKSGILVGSVVDGGPAEHAGLKRGDIIIRFNGTDVGDVDQFRLMVAETGVDREVPVVVLRDGDRKTVEVTLGERPSEVARGDIRQAEEEWLGVRVDDVKGTRGRRVAPADTEEGIVIVGVAQGSPADEAGLGIGDLVEEINGETIDSVDDYENVMEQAKDNRDKPVLFLVERDGINRYIAVKPRQG